MMWQSKAIHLTWGVALLYDVVCIGYPSKDGRPLLPKESLLKY